MSFYKNWEALSEHKAYQQRGLGNGRRFRWLIALDEWYPNYAGGWVLAKLVPMLDGGFKVWVEGADDYAMETREDLTEEVAQEIFENLPSLIDRNTLRNKGFYDT